MTQTNHYKNEKGVIACENKHENVAGMMWRTADGVVCTESVQKALSYFEGKYWKPSVCYISSRDEKPQIKGLDIDVIVVDYVLPGHVYVL